MAEIERLRLLNTNLDEVITIIAPEQLAETQAIIIRYKDKCYGYNDYFDNRCGGTYEFVETPVIELNENEIRNS